jgi:hypothetical protein
MTSSTNPLAAPEDINAARGITLYSCVNVLAYPMDFLPPVTLDAKAALAFLACVCDEHWHSRFKAFLHHRHFPNESAPRIAIGLPYPQFRWHFCTSFIGDAVRARDHVTTRLSREVRGWQAAGCNYVIAIGFPFSAVY